MQDQIRPADWLEIVAGLRFDSFNLHVDDLRPLDPRRVQPPRQAVVAAARTDPQADEDLSLYASYSRSYLPQSGDQFSSLDDDRAGLKPERFDNHEIGAKWEFARRPARHRRALPARPSNTRASDPADPTRTVLTGKQRSRGLELGLERSVTSRWLISAGYTLQNAEITETTRRAGRPRGAAGPAPQLLAVEPL